MSDSLDYHDDPRHFKDGQDCNDPTCPAMQRGTHHTADQTHRRILSELRGIREAKYPHPVYGNMEIGYRGGDVGRQPFLTPAYRAMLQAQEDKDKPHGLHWLWFFAAAILVIGPLEFWAVYLMLR